MMRLILLTFLLISCGGNTSNSGGEVQSEISVFEAPILNGKEVKISTLQSVGSSASSKWYLQLIHKGNKLGECEIHVIDTAENGDHMIAFADESNPFCDGILIDPSSTISNLKLEIEDQGLEYCIVVNDKKTCQEVAISN